MRARVLTNAWLAALLVSVSAAWSQPASPPPIGGPIDVETYSNTGLSQERPAVARYLDGRFVVVWASNDGLGSGNKIYARRHAADGTALDAGAIRVDAATTWVGAPSVETDGDMEFVVVWGQRKAAGYQYEIMGRRFGPDGLPIATDGNPTAAPFVLSTETYAYEYDPDVAVDPGSAFVAVWERDYLELGVREVFARRFDSVDSPVDSSQFQVNTQSYGTQAQAAVSVSDDSRFVVVWSGPEAAICGNSDTDIRGQRYDDLLTSDGAGAPLLLGAEFLIDGVECVLDGSQRSPDVDAEPDESSSFVVSWTDNASGPSIKARAWQSGTPGTVQVVDAAAMGEVPASHVTTDLDGDFTVAWDTYESVDRHVKARSFPRDGGTPSDAFSVSPLGVDGTYSAIAQDDVGNFVVAWQEYAFFGSGTYHDVRVQLHRCFGPDADNDGVGDDCDNCLNAANAGQEDVDADGLGDSCDNCPGLSNPGQANGDADSLGDDCDNCPATDNESQLDADEDGLGDACDNCAATPNPGQEDFDGDTAGDVCDIDDDGDTVIDLADLDPLNPSVCTDAEGDGCDDCSVTNGPPNTGNDGPDGDADGLCDSGDACPADPDNDLDTDGVCGDADNCPATANPGQEDTDGDADGNACDIDDDGDGCLDVEDPQPLVWSTDSDGDGRANDCDPDDDNDQVFDGSDLDPLDPTICVDGDADGCDDCSVTAGPPAAGNDGPDGDADGLCDSGDACPADPDNDLDLDGLCGDADNCPSTANSGQADGDSDSIGDACDSCPADPDNDIDDDGVCGNVDNCPSTANSGQADGDSDSIGDACDSCPADPDNDLDDDAVCGDIDNCPSTANPGQADGDSDSIGDACDTCPADPDNDIDDDGVCGDDDNCPLDPNGPQLDDDGDGTGDACDLCPADPDDDLDADGVCGDVDNCPSVANSGQTDTDDDSAGDACDADDDNDGVDDETDTDPLNPTACADADSDGCDDCAITAGPPEPLNDGLDTDSDGICNTGDNCRDQANADQTDDDEDGIGNTCDNCPAAFNSSQVDQDGDGVGDACDVCPFDSPDDSDGDGSCDSDDLCPGFDDAIDGDADGIPDDCDSCPADASNDSDGDGVCDSDDACPGFDDTLDSDSDGVADGCDPCPFDAADDADGDELCADVDSCPSDPDNDADGDGQCGDVDPCPNDAFDDADGDGLCADVDPCPLDPANDADGDGLCADVDPCPLDPANDADGDLLCTDVDPCPADPDNDADADGLCADVDPCPADADNDADADGLCADVDPCPLDVENDADDDGVCESVDGCPSDPGKSEPGVCGCGVPDGDADGDGVVDCVDNCPFTPNADQTDTNGDSIGDACFNERPLIDELHLSPDEVAVDQPTLLQVVARDVDGQVVSFEYFIDEPGPPGTGTAVPAAPAGSTVTQSIPVDTTGLSAGQHVVFTRARDDENAVSLLYDAAFTVSPSPVPVILVPDYHFTESGPFLASVQDWAVAFEAAGIPAYPVTGSDAWGSPADNALAIEATIALALGETGAAAVDVVVKGGGWQGLWQYLDRAEGGPVRRVAFVASPIGGWSVADAFYGSLLAASSAGNAAAQQRLVQDRALRGLTSAGAEAFRRTHRPLSQLRDRSFLLIAAVRPPTVSDELVLASEVFAIAGENLRTAVWSDLTATVPLHEAICSDSRFFHELLLGFIRAGALTELGQVPDGAQLPMPNSTWARSSLGHVELLEEIGGKFSDTVVTNDDESVTFTQFSVGDDVELTVENPAGKLFTEQNSQGEERVTFSSGTSGDGLSFSQYVLTDPADGDWTFNVDSGSAELTFGKLGRVGSIGALFGVDGFTYPVGETLTAAVAVEPANAIVTSVVTAFIAPDGASTSPFLRDDGAGADDTAGDLLFTGQATLPTRAGALGRWSAQVTVSGTLGGSPFEVSANVFFDLTNGEIRSTGTFSESLIDAGGDGVVEALHLQVEVEVDEPGTYLIAGKLSAPNGDDAGTATTEVAVSASGLTTVTLAYDAESVAASGASGKFTLSELVLARADEDPIIVSATQDVYETGALDTGNFQTDPRPRLRFLNPTGDESLVRSTARIEWQDSDPDSDATIALFLDTDDEGFDGVPIMGAGALSEDSETDHFVLDVSGLPEGEVFVYGIIADERDAVRVYASGPLRVGIDSDGDGLLDSYENANGLDPGRVDSLSDFDRDGLTNGFEAAYGTSPSRADTDGGGESDGRELLYGRDPLVTGDDIFLPFGELLGDVAPAGDYDREVSVGDVVRTLRFAVQAEIPTPDELLRADLAPAFLADAGTEPPTLARFGNGEIDVSDVILSLRVTVQQVRVVEGR